MVVKQQPALELAAPAIDHKHNTHVNIDQADDTNVKACILLFSNGIYGIGFCSLKCFYSLIMNLKKYVSTSRVLVL